MNTRGCKRRFQGRKIRNGNSKTRWTLNKHTFYSPSLVLIRKGYVSTKTDIINNLFGDKTLFNYI